MSKGLTPEVLDALEKKVKAPEAYQWYINRDELLALIYCARDGLLWRKAVARGGVTLRLAREALSGKRTDRTDN